MKVAKLRRRLACITHEQSQRQNAGEGIVDRQFRVVMEDQAIAKVARMKVIGDAREIVRPTDQPLAPMGANDRWARAAVSWVCWN